LPKVYGIKLNKAKSLGYNIAWENGREPNKIIKGFMPRKDHMARGDQAKSEMKNLRQNAESRIG